MYVCFFAKPISIAQFFFFQPMQMEHSAIFWVYDWVGKFWPLDGQFGRLGDMLEEALPCVVSLTSRSRAKFFICLRTYLTKT